MKRFGERILAVCMAAVLLTSGMTVQAEEGLSVSGNDAAVSGNEMADNTAGNASSVSEGGEAGIVSGDFEDEATAVSQSMGDGITTYAGGDIASGTDGGISWVIDAAGKLTVTGTGDLTRDSQTQVEAWAPYQEQITSAEIRVSGMTTAANLFYGCSNLTSVDISGFDTSSITEMSGMFLACGSLTSANLSGLDTSKVIGMSDMFLSCRSLTSVDLSGIDTSSVTSMCRMFFGCTSLTSVDVGGFDTGNVTDMSGMFGDCSSLTSVDVSDFDTGNVTNMETMFWNCTSLTSVNVNGFDTSNVTDMWGMFGNCTSLMSVDVSGFDTSRVTDMEAMFQSCSNLTSLDVSGFDTSKVTRMGHMFSDCSNLTSLDVSGFDTSQVMNMEGMFQLCSNLTRLDVSGFNTSQVTNMGYMFSGCSNLKSLDVSGFDTRSVTGNSHAAPDEPAGGMSFMFSGCSGLTSLDVSNFNTSNVTMMWYMFNGCSGLTSLDMSSFDTSNVTDMSFMLDGCTNLTTLHAPLHVNVQALLPIVANTAWQLPDGTEVTELPQGMAESVVLTRVMTAPQIITTTTDLNMEDVIRVKYVPYYVNLETNNADPTNTVTFSLIEGRLADGLMLYPATGEIYGVPLEAGQFPITVQATYSNPAYLPATAQLILTVLENTDDNVNAASDSGYDITQPVVDFVLGSVAETGSQTMVSQGEYARFQHKVYLDGRLLEEGEGKDYISEEGSTRITIMNQTLSRNGAGTHTLGIEFRTEEGILKRAAQNYTISRSSADISGDANSNTSGNDTNLSGAGDSSGAASVAEEEESEYIIYTVGRGDNLWKIAARFCGNGNAWRRIYEDNRTIIRNPARIYKGQKLIIYLTNKPKKPASPEKQRENLEGSTYIVRSGDSLWTIARRAYGSGSLWKLIYEANKDIIAEPERLRSGRTITIPKR